MSKPPTGASRAVTGDPQATAAQWLRAGFKAAVL